MKLKGGGGQKKERGGELLTEEEGQTCWMRKRSQEVANLKCDDGEKVKPFDKIERGKKKGSDKQTRRVSVVI